LLVRALRRRVCREKGRKGERNNYKRGTSMADSSIGGKGEGDSPYERKEMSGKIV